MNAGVMKPQQLRERESWFGARCKGLELRLFLHSCMAEQVMTPILSFPISQVDIFLPTSQMTIQIK